MHRTAGLDQPVAEEMLLAVLDQRAGDQVGLGGIVGLRREEAAASACSAPPSSSGRTSAPSSCRPPGRSARCRRAGAVGRSARRSASRRRASRPSTSRPASAALVKVSKTACASASQREMVPSSKRPPDRHGRNSRSAWRHGRAPPPSGRAPRPWRRACRSGSRPARTGRGHFRRAEAPQAARRLARAEREMVRLRSVRALRRVRLVQFRPPFHWRRPPEGDFGSPLETISAAAS